MAAAVAEPAWRSRHADGRRLLALDLPLRVLVWEDEGRARLSHLDPAWLGERYGLGAGQMHALDAVHAITDAAVSG